MPPRADLPSPLAGPYRVLMIAPTSFFADYGCHVRILEETRILEQLGCQVTICTYHNGRDLSGVDIRRTMSIPWRQDYEVGSSVHKIGFDLLLFLRGLTCMGQIKPHIIHAHLHEGALIGYVLSRLWRVPLVFDFQGSLTGEMIDHGFLSPTGPLYGAWRRLEEFINRSSPAILTSSAHAAQLLAGEFRCFPERITCVPDCVNTQLFVPHDHDESWRRLRRAWNIPLERCVVVYLGLLATYQGTDHLLEAAQEICARRDDVHFLIGGYPHVERYRHLAQELGVIDHVTFTGKVPYEEAPRLLSLGDIAVSPKLSQTEGAGKLLNYMAVGLPTVVFDTPVSHEYLNVHGVYARRGDSADLARCLESLVDAPERRAQLGAALRQRAQDRYSWDAAAEIILGVYSSMLDRDDRDSGATRESG